MTIVTMTFAIADFCLVSHFGHRTKIEYKLRLTYSIYTHTLQDVINIPNIITDTLFLAAMSTMGVSIFVNAMVTAYTLATHKIDHALFIEERFLYTIVFLLCWTNLDVLALLPWREQPVAALGFPSALIMLASVSCVIFENAPQLTIQALAASSEAGSAGDSAAAIRFLSMASSALMVRELCMVISLINPCSRSCSNRCLCLIPL